MILCYLFFLSGQICSSTTVTDVFTTSVIKTTSTTVTIMTTVTSLTISPSSNINTIKTLCPTGSMTIVTTVTISPSSNINTIKTLCPAGSSDTFTNGSSWVGGILVGVVIGVLVMVMVWVIVTIVRKKRRKMVDNIITYNNRYVQNYVLYVCNLQEQVICTKNAYFMLIIRHSNYFATYVAISLKI